MRGKTLFVANAGDSRAVMAYEDENGELIAKDLSKVNVKICKITFYSIITYLDGRIINQMIQLRS
jgi:hypothetical protein